MHNVHATFREKQTKPHDKDRAWSRFWNWWRAITPIYEIPTGGQARQTVMIWKV